MNEENENLNRMRNELSIIGVLLDDDAEYSGEIENCYAKMQPKHFNTPAFAFAYDVMRSVYRGQGRTATINEITELCKGKYSDLDTILSKARSEAVINKSILKSFCDAVHKDFVNDRLISLTTEQTAANELYSRLNELINDYDDYNNSIDEKKANVLEYITSGKFKSDVDRQKNAADIPTGFPILDTLLGSKDGKKGLFPERLYVIGAVPSLGKTTFVHQIADNIARSGTPVLFFSLEQSENELVLKSIVREQRKARENAGKKEQPLNTNADTILKMLYSGIDQPYIQDAIEAYKATAANMYIYEGNFNTNIDTIRATAKRFIRANRKTPVIIVDYLQILKPVNDKIKDPIAIVDENITALKVLARETHTAVFVISSLSRKGYETDSSYTALKGSGSIEYSADTVFSLVLDIGDKENYSEVFKQMNKTNCRRLKLECLKNRGGQSTFTCYYSYNPQYEYFKEEENEREKPIGASK